MNWDTALFFLGAAIVLTCVLGWIVIRSDRKRREREDE